MILEEIYYFVPGDEILIVFCDLENNKYWTSDEKIRISFDPVSLFPERYMFIGILDSYVLNETKKKKNITKTQSEEKDKKKKNETNI